MISLSPSTVLSYSVGDSYTDYGCTANDDVDGVVPCTTSGTVNTSIIGEYIITYSAQDSAGNINNHEEAFVVLRDATLLDINMDPYYDSAEGLYGEELLLELRRILNDGVSLVTYGDVRYILDETDADPNISGNLILFYDATSIDGDWDDEFGDWAGTFTREHVFPQSLLGVSASNSVANIASDLHNLTPASPSTNSSRGNKYFDDQLTAESYLPRDAVHGDISRILFYMIVMYDQYSLVNGLPEIYEMGDREALLQWYYDDPVDTFEENRNDVIYSYQNNRNPFIDYSHLLELIYFTEGLPLN